METAKHDTDHYLRFPAAVTGGKVTERDEGGLREELLTVLLHDLRSPLGAIGVLADLLSTLSQHSSPADPRQVQLLQEAVTKAQRVLDDALEIQSVIRGSSSLSPSTVQMSSIIATSLEKASHASYLKNAQIDYNPNGSSHNLVRIDVEKAETVFLCVLEQMVIRGEKPACVHITQRTEPPFECLYITEAADTDLAVGADDPHIFNGTLRGRLGTRRLGESRYNMQICRKVMSMMGGRLDYNIDEDSLSVILRFPMAIP